VVLASQAALWRTFHQAAPRARPPYPAAAAPPPCCSAAWALRRRAPLAAHPPAPTPRHRELPQLAGAPAAATLRSPRRLPDGGGWPGGLVVGDGQPARLGLLGGDC